MPYEKDTTSPSPGGGGSTAKRSGWGDSTGKIDHFRRRRAAALRKQETTSEKRLWLVLRQLPTSGSHFRQQVPIGRYVVDFACLAARLVVELDGSQHARGDIAARDRERQAWLEAEGYRVLRFWNSDLDENMEGVLETIRAALYGSVEAESVRLVHKRRIRAATPPRRAARAGPPPPGEGERMPKAGRDHG